MGREIEQKVPKEDLGRGGWHNFENVNKNVFNKPRKNGMLDFLNKKHYSQPVKFDHGLNNYAQANKPRVDLDRPAPTSGSDSDSRGDKRSGQQEDIMKMPKVDYVGPRLFNDPAKGPRDPLDQTDLTWAQGKVVEVNGKQRRRRGGIDLSQAAHAKNLISSFLN